jgi:hypothetical protein
MESLRQYIKSGKVYRRSDLEYYSTAIDRHLSQLVREGTLQKLGHGLYYAPKKSKFGIVPPNDNDMVERFLKTDSFILVSPNSYNMLGLGLSQLYNIAWVYNHKRHGEFNLNGKSFLFKLKSDFPGTLTQEFLIIDLLNNLDELAEDCEQTIRNFKRNLNRYDGREIMKMAQLYGSGATKKIIKSVLHKSQVFYV